MHPLVILKYNFYVKLRRNCRMAKAKKFDSLIEKLNGSPPSWQPSSQLLHVHFI